MKDIIIKKIRPQFTTVITTLDCYDEDIVVDGVIACPKGSLKLYQKVVAVGNNVRDIKEGDLVLLNLKNYLKRNYKEGSIKEEMDTMEDTPVYDFPRITLDGEECGKFQDRDIEGIIKEYEEVEIQTSISTNKLL